MATISRSEITPEALFHSRRNFLRAAGVAAGGVALAACALPGSGAPGSTATASEGSSAALAESSSEVGLAQAAAPLPASLDHSEAWASAEMDELGDPLNDYQAITNYNNYYEFSLDKEEVNPLSQDFTTFPWSLEVTGLAARPRTFSIEELIRNFTQEERIYRLRCVEAWSMVIPWVGFSLGALLDEVQPTEAAKYLHFTSVMRPEEMPGQKRPMLDWPYTEGLRLDEARHPLTILATGMYGKLLTPPNGAPLRLVVPWKYGFKSIKGIVRIELTDQQPRSTWQQAAPGEYGFYANVNPQVNHPRWSQATERRIGERGRRDTLLFNGYADEVASLYEGMDLAANY